MKIKAKLITAMTGVVLLMMMLFYFLVQVEFYIIRDLAYFSNKQTVDKLENSLLHYYQKHQTWDGVEQEVKITDFPFVLADKSNRTEWKNGSQDRSIIVSASFPVHLKVNNQSVGILYVMTDEQYQVYVMKNTWDNYMYGVVGLASLLGVALTILVIYLVSATLTKPIRQLTKKIKQLETGDQQVDFHLKRKDEFKEIGDALASMKENLEKAETARRALVSDVAHELKTPLMVIQGEIELLHIKEKPVSKEKYDSIAQEILRMTTIIDDILHLSKVEAYQVPLLIKPVQVKNLLQQLEKRTRFLFEKHHAKFTYKIDDELMMDVDEEKMLQILYNLVQNALIHGKTTKTVAIEVINQRNGVKILVMDDGIGIQQSDLPYVFERFYRGDESRSRKTGGTGIGLSIVKAYVEMQGGSIHVSSGGNKGTTFTIFFPIKG
jgi:two-component system sensor histidine kinase BaeS